MINYVIEFTGIILCIIGLLQIFIGAKIDKNTIKYFVTLYVCLIMYLSCIIAGLIMKGRPGSYYHAAFLAVTYGEFLLSIITTYSMAQYLLYIIDPNHKRRLIRNFLLIVFSLQTLLLTVSQFTGLYYTIDYNNICHRKSGYPIVILLQILMFLALLYISVRNRTSFTKKEYIAFLVCIIIPLAAMVLQMLFYGVYFVSFATTIAALVMYVLVVSDQTEKFYRNEQENEKLKVDIMISQIQPHFLYNSLGAIQMMCRSNPEAAESAVKEFSLYLRGNMNSISSNVPINFFRELEHTKAYLNLEKLRFEDDLTVEYNIKCINFKIPALTMQPIVENAVRHGIRATSNGKGTVTISTEEFPDHVEVTVSDNGKGFEPNDIPADDRLHIRIKNVRDRLSRICSGKLEITSAPEKGTTVTIILPKGD